MDKSEATTTIDLPIEKKDKQKLIRGFIFACTEKSEAECIRGEKVK